MKYRVQQINEINLNGKGSVKDRFVFESEKVFEVDQKYLDNCIDKQTIKFFESLGGSEELKIQKDHVSVISTCPQNFHRITQNFYKIVTE